jgi:uncharacterized coiled-coil protein SlyX
MLNDGAILIAFLVVAFVALLLLQNREHFESDELTRINTLEMRVNDINKRTDSVEKTLAEQNAEIETAQSNVDKAVTGIEMIV